MRLNIYPVMHSFFHPPTPSSLHRLLLSSVYFASFLSTLIFLHKICIIFLCIYICIMFSTVLCLSFNHFNLLFTQKPVNRALPPNTFPVDTHNFKCIFLVDLALQLFRIFETMSASSSVLYWQTDLCFWKIVEFFIIDYS